ncbi:OLC1v1031933C1 [Oldenlandia corymbosa var. corymbosa]|uniref:OLC1v1031933C1 n=1 Tax=Oldenlandia corymbosa var. corymbosa TaxID=529605 RepID=A0AAV1CLA2_OLDCO|nr:OLC1v1031933C1 [Oldenlandia corymbosa var. corymbosa]
METPREGEGPDGRNIEPPVNNPLWLDLHHQTPPKNISVMESTSSSLSDVEASTVDTDIFEMLSNAELYPAATLSPLSTDQAISNILESSSSHGYEELRCLLEEMEESNEHKKKKKKKPSPEVPQITPSVDAEKRKRDSDCYTSRQDVRPRGCRSNENHNMAERTRRDQIRRNMKDLQDLIPNCNTVLSSGGFSMFQDPTILPSAGYQIVQTPQFPPFTPMDRFGIRTGMGMFNFPPISSVPFMPFAFPVPGQLTPLPSAPGMNLSFGQMNHLELPPDSALMAPSLPSFYPNLPPTIASSFDGGWSTSSQTVRKSLNLSSQPP